MWNNDTNGKRRTMDRESIRRKIAEIARDNRSTSEFFAAALAVLLENVADSVAVDLVQDDGSIVREITLHNDGQKQQTLTQHRDGHPLPTHLLLWLPARDQDEQVAIYSQRQ